MIVLKATFLMGLIGLILILCLGVILPCMILSGRISREEEMEANQIAQKAKTQETPSR